MREKIKIVDLMKRLELPNYAQFVGFVVHLPHSDEFLSHYTYNDFGEGFIWSKVPDLAHSFESQSKAEKFVKSYRKSSVVGLLFDLGDSYSLHLAD